MNCCKQTNKKNSSRSSWSLMKSRTTDYSDSFKQSHICQSHIFGLLFNFQKSLTLVDATSVNWLSQTKKNLIIEFLDLNFASRRKLCKNSIFYEKMNSVALILCGRSLFSYVLAHFRFAGVYHFQAFLILIF